MGLCPYTRDSASWGKCKFGEVPVRGCQLGNNSYMELGCSRLSRSHNRCIYSEIQDSQSVLIFFKKKKWKKNSQNFRPIRMRNFKILNLAPKRVSKESLWVTDFMKFRHKGVILRHRSNEMNWSLGPIKQPEHSKYAFRRPSILTWNTLLVKSKIRER